MRFCSPDGLDADVVDQFAGGRDGHIYIGAIVADVEFDLVSLAANLDAAGVVDLLGGQFGGCDDRIAGRNERSRLGRDDADLEFLVRAWAAFGESAASAATVINANKFRFFMRTS